MKIESLLRRPGGTKVTLDGAVYHFKPGPDGREFAEVTNADHIRIFAAIPEGYRAYGVTHVVTNDAPADSPAPAPIAPVKTADVPRDLDKLDRPALAQLYEKFYGHRPPPRLGEAKLVAAIKASAH